MNKIKYPVYISIVFCAALSVFLPGTVVAASRCSYLAPQMSVVSLPPAVWADGESDAEYDFAGHIVRSLTHSFDDAFRLTVSIEFSFPVKQSDLLTGVGLYGAREGDLSVRTEFVRDVTVCPAGYVSEMKIISRNPLNPNHAFFVRYARGLENNLEIWRAERPAGAPSAHEVALSRIPSLVCWNPGDAEIPAAGIMEKGTDGFGRFVESIQFLGNIITLNENPTDEHAQSAIHSWLQSQFRNAPDTKTAIENILEEFSRFQMGYTVAYIQVLDYLYEMSGRNMTAYRPFVTELIGQTQLLFQRHFLSSPAYSSVAVDDNEHMRYVALRMLEAVGDRQSLQALNEIISNREADFLRFRQADFPRRVRGALVRGAPSVREQRGLDFVRRIRQRVLRGIESLIQEYEQLSLEFPSYTLGEGTWVDKPRTHYRVPIFIRSRASDVSAESRKYFLEVVRQGTDVQVELAERRPDESGRGSYIIGMISSRIEERGVVVTEWNVPSRNFDLEQARVFRDVLMSAALKFLVQHGFTRETILIDGSVFRKNVDPWDIFLLERKFGMHPDFSEISKLERDLASAGLWAKYYQRGSGRLAWFPYIQLECPDSRSESLGVPLFVTVDSRGRPAARAQPNASVSQRVYRRIALWLNRSKINAPKSLRREDFLLGVTHVVTKESDGVFTRAMQHSPDFSLYPNGRVSGPYSPAPFPSFAAAGGSI